MSAVSAAVAVVQQNPLFGLYKHYIIDGVVIAKRHGFKELIRRRGWKFLLLIAGYYLVRDSILYVAIPLYLAHGLP
jgi:hypothetical protein